MSAREAIFASIRRSLSRGPLSTERTAGLEARVARHAPNLIPQRSRVDHGAQIELFVRMAGEVGATFARVGSFADVPAAVATYLERNDLPTAIRMSPDPALDRIPWGDAPGLSITRGRADVDTLVGVTPSFAAVAETGTLLMLSGPERPATLNFLPDTHIVVLEAKDVVGAYEDALVKLRTTVRSADYMPRTVNFITGPSRTADIALQIVRGAHGPRRLHVVIVGT